MPQGAAFLQKNKVHKKLSLRKAIMQGVRRRSRAGILLPKPQMCHDLIIVAIVPP